jgi:hypothetical protein
LFCRSGVHWLPENDNAWRHVLRETDREDACEDQGFLTELGMLTTTTLRLQLLVAREIRRVGSPTRLAQLIKEANAQTGSKLTVDRRTLLKIRDAPGKVSLTLNILYALHIYFKQLGEGLHKLPILATCGLVEPLFDAERVVFMLGAKPRPAERRVDLSRWDALALAELVKEASRFDRRHEFDIEDVLWRNPVDPSAIKSEKWYSLLEMDQTSVISIGSPIAALSSEVMLARMFNVAPFESPRFSTRLPLPFYFAWAPRVSRGFRSAFGLTWKELMPEFKQLAQEVRQNRTAAFILNGLPHSVPTESKTWTMYGVIAAQRRASGSVWLVVSGLAGPATLAAARLVKRVSAELPFAENQNSPVLWMPMKVAIKTGRASSVVSGDLREIVDAELVGEPNFWPKSVS